MILKNTKEHCQLRQKIVLENYDKNLTLTELHKLLVLKIENISDSVIAKVLKNNNLELKDGRGKVTERKFIKNPFELGNSNNEYWLGFLLGDGYLSKYGSNIRMFSNDFEFLRTFNNHIGIKCSETIVKTGKNPHLVLYFGNNRIWQYLNTLNITTKKSLILDPFIKLNWNIVRGLFDADGSISKGEFKITSASIKMIDKLEDFFKENNFVTRIVQKGNAFDIYIRYTNGSRSKEEALITRAKLYNLLYENAEYYLPRKKLYFRALLQQCNIEKSEELLEKPEEVNQQPSIELNTL